MENLRRINRQFYIFWKKESIEWRPRLLIVKKNFRILKHLSERLDICIYKFILMLLESKNECITRKERLIDILRIDLSEKEYTALLSFAGYYYHRPSRTYKINDERAKRVMNVCDATDLFAREAGCFRGNIKMNQKKYNHYQEKIEKYSRKCDKIKLNESLQSLRIEPANGERYQTFYHVTGKILFILGLVFVILVIAYARSIIFGGKETAESRLAFENSLIGACIPGMVTIATTYFLIKHEYKVDYHRERMSSLPVFSFVYVHDKNKYINNNGKWNGENNPYEMLVNTAENDNFLDKNVDLYILCNKGEGMAFNVSHDRGDEEFFFGDISKNGEKIIAMKKCSSLYYVISYMDIYGNKYTQRFDVDNRNDKYNITTFPPELVFRTKLIRYQQ